MYARNSPTEVFIASRVRSSSTGSTTCPISSVHLRHCSRSETGRPTRPQITVTGTGSASCEIASIPEPVPISSRMPSRICAMPSLIRSSASALKTGLTRPRIRRCAAPSSISIHSRVSLTIGLSQPPRCSAHFLSRWNSLISRGSRSSLATSG